MDCIKIKARVRNTKNNREFVSCFSTHEHCSEIRPLTELTAIFDSKLRKHLIRISEIEKVYGDKSLCPICSPRENRK